MCAFDLRLCRAHVSAERLDLVAVETDSGPLGDARLYLPEAFLAHFRRRAPARRGASQRFPLLPPSIAYVAQQFIDAVAFSAVYGGWDRLAADLGITGRINLAFGEIAMLGAYRAIGGIAVLVTLGSMIRSPALRWFRWRPRSPDCGAPRSAAT